MRIIEFPQFDLEDIVTYLEQLSASKSSLHRKLKGISSIVTFASNKELMHNAKQVERNRHRLGTLELNYTISYQQLPCENLV